MVSPTPHGPQDAAPALAAQEAVTKEDKVQAME